jgi:sugar transferase (PEP-CTERM system associated)
MQVFNRYVSPRGVTVFAGEILLVFGSITTAAYLHGGLADPITLWKIGLATCLCQICLYYNDLYDLTVVHSNRELLVRLLQAAGAASIILGFLYFAVPTLEIGRGIFLSSILLFLVAILGWRLLINAIAALRRLEEHILIVGTGPTARLVARQILSQHDYGYRVVGFIGDDPALLGQRIVNPCVVGLAGDIGRIVERERIDRIVVGLSDRRGTLPIQELLSAKLSGIRVEDATTTYERLTGKILVDDLRPSWLIFSDGFRASRSSRLIKRGLDVVFSFIGFVVSAPLMALTALAVWLESGRPILYRQERVGQGGTMFTLYKFRSMRIDAESGTPMWARDDDDRVTRVGGFIRKARLDELPQFWNVLRGDMSFVGPRPERPYFIAQLTEAIPFYQQRHAVRPGLTGWAQVKYRYGSSVEDALEKLRYDLYYIKHLSVIFDLTILIDTVKVILFRQGAK